jgi:ferredoxin--NADP+ reductase
MTNPTIAPAAPELPAAQMHLVPPAQPVTGRVVSTRRCTASSKAAGFIRHVVIDVGGTPLAGNFLAGQSFGVLAPGLDARGQPHKVRLYSIASPRQGEDGQGRHLATTVKRTIDEHHESHALFLGVCSNYLCDLREGDPVNVSGPNGKRFLLPSDSAAHDYVFFATGTGIAPFRGMLMELAASGFRGRATLVLGSPYATDLPYHDDLLAMARQHPWFSYQTAISREASHPSHGTPDAPGKGRYVQDLIAQGSPLAELLASPNTLIYVCGIAGMELGIFQRLATALPDPARAQYLTIEPDAGDPTTWDRRMIHRQIKPSKRVFLEVY